MRRLLDQCPCNVYMLICAKHIMVLDLFKMELDMVTLNNPPSFCERKISEYGLKSKLTGPVDTIDLNLVGFRA